MALKSHWGEMTMEQEQHEYLPEVILDIEQAMDPSFTDKYDETGELVERLQQISLPVPDPLILHAIDLHKYANDVSGAIQLCQINKKKIISLEEAVGTIPPMPQITVHHKTNNLNYVPKDFTDFSTGKDVEVPDLSSAVVEQVIRKSVATLFAQVGFETSDQGALDVICDVLPDFMKRLCCRYKVALEDQEAHQSTGFPHPIEKALTELGMGGVKSLDDYYQSRVIRYVDVLTKRCNDLGQQYHNLMIPKSPTPMDNINKVVRVKVEAEEEVVEVEHTEVHFSTIDGDVNYSILETGYQLLNSLEAETNLQNLVGGEQDAAVAESPGVGAVSSENYLSHLSPFSKKRRLK